MRLSFRLRPASLGAAALLLLVGLPVGAAPAQAGAGLGAALPGNRSLLSAEAEQRPTLAPVKLGTVPGAIGTWAVAVNNRSQVVGTAAFNLYGTLRPFLWERGRMRDLGDFGARSAYAVGINDVGQVLIVSEGLEPGNEDDKGLIWQDGRVTDIGRLGDMIHPVKINNRGQVLAISHTPVEGFRAVVWAKGRFRVLAGLPGGDGYTWPTDLNDRGDVVGTSSSAELNRPRPVIWQRGRGVPIDLGPVDGNRVALNNSGQVAVSRADGQTLHAALWSRGQLRQVADRPSVAAGVNEHGLVVGWVPTWVPDEMAWGQSGQPIAVRGGQVTLLPQPAGFTFSAAEKVNNHDQILGRTSDTTRSLDLAVVWQAGTVRVLAPTTGAQDTVTYGSINDRGEVVGMSTTMRSDIDYNDLGDRQALLWRVPAP